MRKSRATGRPVGRPCVWPWRILEVGQGFSIPRRVAGAYMRDPETLRALARRQGVRISYRRFACGITVIRAPDRAKPQSDTSPTVRQNPTP